MRLCVTCRHALHDVELPGWVFVPVDLDIFLDAEREDFDRRQREFRATGQFPIRQCPPIEEYIERCGTYDAYMLRSFSAPTSGWRADRSSYLPASKSWHGDPMIALFKGCNALANERLLPAKIRDLNLLYHHNDASHGQNLNTHSAFGRSHNHDYQQGPGNANNSAPPPSRSEPGSGSGRRRGRPPKESRASGNHNAGRVNSTTQDQAPYCGTIKGERQPNRYNKDMPIKVRHVPWV